MSNNFLIYPEVVLTPNAGFLTFTRKGWEETVSALSFPSKTPLNDLILLRVNPPQLHSSEKQNAYINQNQIILILQLPFLFH